MTDDMVDRIARALYERMLSDNGVEVEGGWDDAGISQEIWRGRARVAIEAHKTALAEFDEATVEPIVKADFMVWGVYSGYTQDAKEAEWQRMRGIEIRAFLRRWRAMIGAAPTTTTEAKSPPPAPRS